MEKSMDKIIETVMSNKLYISIIIGVIAFVIYKAIEKTINRVLERDKKHQKLDRKSKTAVKLSTNIAKYIIFVIALVLILQVNGVNVNSLVAGLGIVSVIAGLAIQDPLKDIISGMNIVSDEYFAIGDSIKIDDIEGKVISMGIRTTKIKDFKYGNIYTIANRNISKALKISDELYIDVPLSYEDNTKHLEEILRNAAANIEKLENVIEAKYIGINEFADSCIIFKMKILCKPENRFAVKRAANGIIKSELDKNNISIPYPQITVHSSRWKIEFKKKKRKE